MPPQVPLELVAEIFLFLPLDDNWDSEGPTISQSKQTFDACSRVCRSWRPFALHHLFHDVVYSYCRDPDDVRIQPKVQKNRWGFRKRAKVQAGRWAYHPDDREDVPRPRKTFSMFAIFLETHPHIRSYIRRLSLRGNPGQLEWDLADEYWAHHFEEVRDAVPAEDFVKLLLSLPRLEVLHLFNVFFLQQTLASDLFARQASLQQLSVSASRTRWHIGKAFFREYDLAVILRCFEAVDDLEIEGLSQSESSSTLAPMPDSLDLTPTRIRSFAALRLACSEPALKDFILSCSPPRRLVISYSKFTGFLSLTRPVIHHVAPALEEAHLVFPVGSLCGSEPPLDFSMCTRLHTLSLGLPTLDHLSITNPRLNTLFAITLRYIVLAVQLAPPSLRRVALNLGRPTRLWSMDLTTPLLDGPERPLAPLHTALLNLARHNVLEEVRIECIVDEYATEKLRDRLMSAFPPLTEETQLAIKLIKHEELDRKMYGY